MISLFVSWEEQAKHHQNPTEMLIFPEEAIVFLLVTLIRSLLVAPQLLERHTSRPLTQLTTTYTYRHAFNGEVT